MSPLPKIAFATQTVVYGPALTAYRGGGWESPVAPPPPPPPGPGNGFELEDGSGLILLEDGVSYLLQE